MFQIRFFCLKKFKNQKCKGAALLAVLAIITLCSVMAVAFVSQVQLSAKTSSAALENLQKDLLTISAQEEAKTILACSKFYDCKNNKLLIKREVKNSSGKVVGQYSFRLYDEACKAAAENIFVPNSIFETKSKDIRKTVYNIQQISYKTRKGIFSPANINLPDKKLKETIDLFFAKNNSEKSKKLFAEITDLIDDNHSVSESGKEAISASRLFLNNYHKVLPLAFHDYEQNGKISTDKKQTSELLHIGRLERGWAIEYKDWGKQEYRYIDTKKSKINNKIAKLVFKPFGYTQDNPEQPDMNSKSKSSNSASQKDIKSYATLFSA